MAGRLDGRVAIVTGGGHGIGKAYARGLAGEGASVVIAEIDAACRQRGRGCAGAGRLQGDRGRRPTSPTGAASRRWRGARSRPIGRIDILVNNAAIFATVPMSRAPFDQIDPAEWDRMMSVNLKGPGSLPARSCRR